MPKAAARRRRPIIVFRLSIIYLKCKIIFYLLGLDLGLRGELDGILPVF